jgi:hypothetical protein
LRIGSTCAKVAAVKGGQREGVQQHHRRPIADIAEDHPFRRNLVLHGVALCIRMGAAVPVLLLTWGLFGLLAPG